MLNYPNYYLILSSSMFAVPTIYAAIKSKIELSTLTSFTMICSINYWSNGNGKILDLYVLKISGIIYFIYGNYYITENKIKSLGYLNTFCLLNCYYYE